jgi:hypothetical protein
MHQHYRTRYSTSRISAMPKQLLVSLLLVVAFNPRPLQDQLKAETRLLLLEVPPETSDAPPASTNKTIAVVLRKSIDASKLKAGETYIVEGGSSISSVPSLPPAPCCTQIVMSVIDASRLNKNSGDSRISLQFEPLHPGTSSGLKPILHLEIQAIASPAAISWSPSLVIVDRFPCDPKSPRTGATNPTRMIRHRGSIRCGSLSAAKTGQKGRKRHSPLALRRPMRAASMAIPIFLSPPTRMAPRPRQ